MGFSENLKRLQAENNESNYKLAKILGVHATTIQNWHNGRTPRLEHAIKVAKHYGTSLEALMS